MLTDWFTSVLPLLNAKLQPYFAADRTNKNSAKFHPVCMRLLWKTFRRRRLQPARSSSPSALFLLSKFPRKAEDHPAAPSTTPISCAQLICINVSKGCRSILAGAFIGCAAVKQCWRIGRANARKGREKTNIKSALCSSLLPYLRSRQTWIIPPSPISDPKLVNTEQSCFFVSFFSFFRFFFRFFFSVCLSQAIAFSRGGTSTYYRLTASTSFSPDRMRENRGAWKHCS